MRRMLYVAFIVAALAGMMNTSAQTVTAEHGSVCIGPFRGGDSVSQCEHIDKVMVEQIYEEDFCVVHMQDDKNMATYIVLIIEEQ